MIGVVVGGLGLLVGLAAVVGVLLDREARESAWARVASARHINGERARANAERASALDAREELLDSREHRIEIREQHLVELEAHLAAKERSHRS